MSAEVIDGIKEIIKHIKELRSKLYSPNHREDKLIEIEEMLTKLLDL
jgi:hypothetical protein